MKDFDYYLLLGCCILTIIGCIGLCIYLYISRKYKGNNYIQEIAAFTFCNILLICTVIYALVIEILYRYYHS